MSPAAAAAAGGNGPAGSTGPGWGALQQEQQQGEQHPAGSSSSSSRPVVLGLSWELARQQGDRIAAVSTCPGAQFSCCLLQQQQQHHADAHSAGPPARVATPSTPWQRMSQPGRSLVRPRPVIFAAKTGGICPADLLAPPNLLAHWTATHQHLRSSSSSRNPAAARSSSPNVQPRSPTKALSPAAPYAASSSNSLSGFMSQVLDQLRWPPDPWVIGEYPTRRGGMSMGSAALSHVQAGTLAAHPNRPLFVSGSSTGRIYLWQFGEVNCKAAYVPLASTGQVRGGEGAASTPA